jgi:hypothetical protein
MAVRSNCIIFAVALYLRRHRKGREGYIMMRHSRATKLGPHWLYAERRSTGTMRIVSYVPTRPVHRLLPPPVFTGSSRWGDLP